MNKPKKSQVTTFKAHRARSLALDINPCACRACIRVFNYRTLKTK